MSAVQADRLHRYRKAKRMSLQELAEAAGCAKSHLWELEQNRQPMEGLSWRLVKSISAALGVSVLQLMDDPQPSPIWPEGWKP